MVAVRLRLLLIIVAALSAGSLPNTVLAGQLGQLRETARTELPPQPAPEPSQPSSGPSTSWGSCDDDDEDDDLEVGSFWLLLAILSAPWSVPHIAAGDEFGKPAYFADAPYDYDNGYLAIAPVESEQFRTWGGHFRAEYADDFDGLMRFGGRLVLEHTLRVGIDTEWNYWHENLGGGDHDQLSTGDANIVLRFAQNKHLAMRSGIGFNWLDDQQETNFGFNFTYGVDYFPCKPWILSADIDWGTLGARTLFHGRATAGVIVGHAEVFVGYDYYDVGDVGLNGLVAGVGVWF